MSSTAAETVKAEGRRGVELLAAGRWQAAVDVLEPAYARAVDGRVSAAMLPAVLPLSGRVPCLRPPRRRRALVRGGAQGVRPGRPMRIGVLLAARRPRGPG